MILFCISKWKNIEMVKTRFQIKEENKIMFDEGSAAWNRNKKRVGQSYVYVCGCLNKKGGLCQKLVRPNTVCFQHSKTFKKE